jgi:hypothetical protein
MTPAEPVKILNIAGAGGSGTTLLVNILGQYEGFFAGGELCYLWSAFGTNRPCACGKHFLECDVWKQVFCKAFGTIDQIHASEWRRLLQTVRLWHYPALLSEQGQQALSRKIQPYLDSLVKVYHSVHRVTGCRLIIETSKDIHHGILFSRYPELEHYTLHVVRDSRGVGYARVKRKKSVAGGAVNWMLFNSIHERWGRQHPERYLRIRYEDFVHEPEVVVRRILGFLPFKDLDKPLFSDSHTVQLEPTHNIAGNHKVRSLTGAVQIRADDVWQTKLSGVQKALITALTLPQLRRYGYNAGGGKK